LLTNWRQQIVSDPNLRRSYGRDAVLLLTILLQYKKYESENPYIVKLSILDDEMALTGLAMIMSSSFAEYNRYNNHKRGLYKLSWECFVTLTYYFPFIKESTQIAEKNKTVNRLGGIMWAL
jgi:hypothetical protein